MNFETVQIHFFKRISSCHPEILLPWQRDVTIGIKQNEPDSHDNKRL